MNSRSLHIQCGMSLHVIANCFLIPVHKPRGKTMSLRSASFEVTSVKTSLDMICMTGDYDRSRIPWRAVREGSMSPFMSLPRMSVAGCGLRPAGSDCSDGWSGESLIVRFEEADAGAPDPEIFEVLPQSCSRSPPRPIRCHMN